MTEKDYIKKVTITTYWDDDFGNIDHNDDGNESDKAVFGQILSNVKKTNKIR